MTTNTNKYQMRCTNCGEIVTPEKFCGKEVCPDCVTDTLAPLTPAKPKTKARKPTAVKPVVRTTKVISEREQLFRAADELGDIFGEF